MTPEFRPLFGHLAEILASTAEVSEAVNRWFRKSNSLPGNGIWVVIVVAIGLLWVGLYFWDRSRRLGKRGSLDRDGLFTQLCDLHKLSKSERQLLRTIAKTQCVDQPALAFVKPNLLLSFAESTPGSSTDARHLADRLFGRGLVEEIVKESRNPSASIP